MRDNNIGAFGTWGKNLMKNTPRNGICSCFILIVWSCGTLRKILLVFPSMYCFFFFFLIHYYCSVPYQVCFVWFSRVDCFLSNEKNKKKTKNKTTRSKYTKNVTHILLPFISFIYRVVGNRCKFANWSHFLTKIKLFSLKQQKNMFHK